MLRGTLRATFDPTLDLQSVATLAPSSPYTQSLEQIAPNVTSLVASTQVEGENWWDTLVRIAPSIITTYQQKQLLDVQVERARAGLPPLDASQYAAAINVGVSADTRRAMYYIAGAALVGLLALSIYSRRR